jgi:hypothetical protein
MIKAVALHVRVSSERQAQQATIASHLAVLCTRAVADEHVVLSGDEYVANGCVGSTPRAPTLERSRGRAAQGAMDPLCLDRSLRCREEEPPTLARADQRAEIPRRFAP